MGTRWTIAILTMAATATAHAGNDDELLIGNQAMMTGGAVTAMISDGGAIYYNPAGISNVGYDSADVGGSAFTLRLYRMPGLISSESAASNASMLELVSVPTALSVIRAINDHWHIGFGIFVPKLRSTTLRASFQAPVDPLDPDSNHHEWLVTSAEKSSLYYLSFALGWQPSERFRFGVGVSILYESFFVSSQFAGGIQTSLDETLTFISGSRLAGADNFGARFSLGFQWEITDRLRLGFVTQPTGFHFLHFVSDSETFASGEGEGEESEWGYVTFNESFTEASVSAVTPWRIGAGLAYEWDRGWAAVDADVRLVVGNLNRALSWNVRAGAFFQLSEKLNFGLGFFTDRSSHPGLTDADLTIFDVDLYGLSTGFQFSKHRALDGDVEEEDELIFSTSFGLRYAHGRGETIGISLIGDGLQLVRTPARIHEIGIYLGTAFMF